MSSRLDDVLADLGDEVAALRLERPEAVRRRGSARRRNRAVGAVAAIGVVAAVTVGTAVTGAVSLPGTGRGGSSAGVPATAPEPSGTGCDDGPVEFRGSPDAMSARYVSVFLDDAVTPAQKDAVANVLRTWPSVERFRFEDRATAFERFRQIYVCAPDFAAIDPADSVQESFRITMRSAIDVAPLTDLLGGLPGVNAVVSGPHPN